MTFGSKNLTKQTQLLPLYFVLNNCKHTTPTLRDNHLWESPLPFLGRSSLVIVAGDDCFPFFLFLLLIFLARGSLPLAKDHNEPMFWLYHCLIARNRWNIFWSGRRVPSTMVEVLPDSSSEDKSSSSSP